MDSEFLTQLRQQTIEDVKNIKKLSKQQDQIKQQLTFFTKRVKSANDILLMSGQEAVK